MKIFHVSKTNRAHVSCIHKFKYTDTSTISRAWNAKNACYKNITNFQSKKSNHLNKYIEYFDFDFFKRLIKGKEMNKIDENKLENKDDDDDDKLCKM